MPNLNDVPNLYLFFTIAITAYQSYRGFMFQWIFAKERKVEDYDESIEQQNRQLKWTRTQKIILLCIADLLFYFITTLSGFVALFLSYHILTNIKTLTEVSTGLVTLLIFLIVFGLLGVSAQLPTLIQQGKLTPWKQ